MMAALATAMVVGGLAVLLVGEYLERDRLKQLGKPIASTGFLVVALTGGALGDAYGRLILAALVGCWVGDVCLLSRDKALFLAGLGAFLLGHVAFAASFAVLGPDLEVAAGAAVGLAAPAWFVGRHWLGPHLPDDLRGPVWAYIAVITIMLALAVGVVLEQGLTRAWAVGLGALAFYLSDLSVARDRFVRAEFLNAAWGLPLYYGAVTLLAWTVHMR